MGGGVPKEETRGESEAWLSQVMQSEWEHSFSGQPQLALDHQGSQGQHVEYMQQWR